MESYLGVLGGALGALVWATIGWLQSDKPFDLRKFLATSLPAMIIGAGASMAFPDFLTPFLFGALGKSLDEKTIGAGDQVHGISMG